MVSNTPTEAERSVLSDLVDQSRTAVPGVKVRFVERAQQPGEQGLLVGMELPANLQADPSQVFALQDICEAQTRKRNLPIGLTVSQSPGGADLLDLAFLPPDAVAPANEAERTRITVRRVAITAAVLVLLLVVGFIIRNPKPDSQLAGTHDTEAHKPAPQRSPVIATPSPDGGATLFHQASYEVTSQQKGGATHYQTSDSTVRQQTLDQLNHYATVLRSTGHTDQADRVQKMILDLP